MNGVPPDGVKAMIELLYTDDYTHYRALQVPGQLLLHAEAYTVSKVFRVVELSNISTDKLKQTLLRSWNAALPAFPAALRTIYENVDERQFQDLKTCLLDLALHNKGSIIAPDMYWEMAVEATDFMQAFTQELANQRDFKSRRLDEMESQILGRKYRSGGVQLYSGGIIASLELKALQAGEYSDLTIRLSNGEELKGHRIILCTHCEFFANAVKNGNFKEGQTGVIEMKNDPPGAVKKLIEYLYTEDYKIDQHMNVPMKLAADAEVYAVAVIYMVPELVKLAKNRIEFAFANAFSSQQLQAFPCIVKSICEHVPESDCALQRILYDFAREHFEWLTSPEILKELVEEAPNFMSTLFRGVKEEASALEKELSLEMSHSEELEQQLQQSKGKRGPRTYKCPTCRNNFDMILPEVFARLSCPVCLMSRSVTAWKLEEMESDMVADNNSEGE
ncbi:putative btb poz domain protein [Neofusicoccum parvum UCRNP2]|uniref:Putative btb poz domain protein n=1 Tax=Botryosphaeria parva (strain UCR-NP2) TaxID=1287680 RepID=R1GTK3_BOTPV|nr:putative btb poz domain protein [Neofusicoccum parvum UCRNP2]